MMSVRASCIAAGLALLSLLNLQKQEASIPESRSGNRRGQDRNSSILTIQVPNALKSIVDGSYSLIGVHYKFKHPEDLSSVNVSYCNLDWSHQKIEPESYPRYHNVINSNRNTCNATKLTFALEEVLMYAKAYDKTPHATVSVMEQSGFIFHESRSGSTLAANMLTVADPRGNRVYSEPGVLLDALTSRNTELVKHILYLMSRSSDPAEKRVFFKIRSTGVRRIRYMPSGARWLFLYRNPTDVLLSHFNPSEETVGGVVCLKSRNSPRDSELRVAAEAGYSNYKNLTDEGVCAVRFASLSHAAILQWNSTGEGRFVNYNTIPESLYDDHFPNYFGFKVHRDSRKRMQVIAGVYSKGNRHSETKSWEDNGDETKNITKGMKKAAKQFMRSDYEFMNAVAAIQ